MEKTAISLYVPKELHKALKIAAAEEGKSVTEIVSKIVNDYLKARNSELNS